jgi:predicted signal transduction protein with EAL and GGDEF domain
MILASALAVGVLNHELGRSFRLQGSEHAASENRAAIWSRMAAVVREIDAPDVDRATHDCLTGLPNRELSTQRLARSLHGRLTVDPPVTVCLLDHFEYLNDSRGDRDRAPERPAGGAGVQARPGVANCCHTTTPVKST